MAVAPTVVMVDAAIYFRAISSGVPRDVKVIGIMETFRGG